MGVKKGSKECVWIYLLATFSFFEGSAVVFSVSCSLNRGQISGGGPKSCNCKAIKC